MKVKEESEKVCLKLNIQKAKIMASGPITSWEVYGEIVETVAEFIFLKLFFIWFQSCRDFFFWFVKFFFSLFFFNINLFILIGG